MHRFKKGDAVWILKPDRFGYPRLMIRPGKIVKRVHPTCYVVATMIGDYTKKPVGEWLIVKSDEQQRHPGDLLPFADDPQNHLRALQARWRKETSPDVIAARDAAEAEHVEMNRRLQKTLGPLFNFANMETKRRLKR